MKLLKRIILELAWKADGVCHAIIEWADPLPVKTVEQLRELVKGTDNG